MKFIAIFGVTIILAGCSIPPTTIDYAPTSALAVKGRVGVSGFLYLPFNEGKVKADQLQNTNMYAAFIKPDVATVMREALFKEFRSVGIDVARKDRLVSGEIIELSEDDKVGWDANWVIDIRYKVTDQPSGQAVYEGEKITKAKAGILTFDPPVLNRNIKDNIEQLLRDKDFLNAIN